MYQTSYTVDGVKTKTRESILWYGMKNRVFGGRHKNYLDCSISENFLDYQFFAHWCHNQIGWNEDNWHLDKDLIVEGNKEYHEDKCVFVPRVINTVLNSEKLPRDNGLPLGVVYAKEWNQYQARCNVFGVQKYLGAYKTPEEAHQSYVKRKNEYVQELAEMYKGRVRDEVYVKLRDFVAE